MKRNMLGTSLILLLLLTGCGDVQHKSAAQTAGATVTEMTVTESAVTDKTASDTSIRKESETGRAQTKALDETSEQLQSENSSTQKAEQEMTMEISIGDKTYAVRLEDNETVKELTARLPMELTMEELHGNEKYNYLPEALPTAAEAIGTIHAGDLMLFGSGCLVLFYEDFETTYSYTRIGRLENSSGLSETLGSGSVIVTFER